MPGWNVATGLLAALAVILLALLAGAEILAARRRRDHDGENPGEVRDEDRGYS